MVDAASLSLGTSVMASMSHFQGSGFSRSSGNPAGSSPTDDRKVNPAITSRKALFPPHQL
jgi:hypothetical protein